MQPAELPTRHHGTKLTILILGVLTTVSPFAIDMYLASFPQMAAALNTTVAKIALSLSSYFVGLAVGQVAYGPLLDRFGRKRPLYAGLALFVLGCIGCMCARNIEMLIVFRFFQALGGCAAGVAAMAMVRDFFPVSESARVISLLMLILGVSPLAAPTVGSFIAVHFGWQWVFVLLATIVVLISAAVFLWLPEGHQPDKTISLHPKPIVLTFIAILKEPHFYTYAVSGAFSFAGLLVYVAGSPIIFMTNFHVSAQIYGGIFAMLAAGFIGGSQVNLWLTKKFQSSRIYLTAVCVQTSVVLVFLLGAINNWWGLYSTIGMLFLYLSSTGLTYPNAAALALAPFGRNAGSAAALLGFLQIGVASMASAGVGFFEAGAVPPIAIMAGTAVTGIIILLAGRRTIKPAGEPIEPALPLPHG